MNKMKYKNDSQVIEDICVLVKFNDGKVMQALVQQKSVNIILDVISSHTRGGTLQVLDKVLDIDFYRGEKEKKYAPDYCMDCDGYGNYEGGTKGQMFTTCKTCNGTGLKTPKEKKEK